ncbi:MAG: hypothetical protein HY881_04650 [Deltaproteobacteria bacterium]|nr:hypothetical protein [Deltaproteobacteria bacterium]
MTKDAAQRRRWTFYEAIKDVYQFYSLYQGENALSDHQAPFKADYILEIGVKWITEGFTIRNNVPPEGQQ